METRRNLRMNNDTVERIERNLSLLDSLLGENNVEEMKKKICDLIVDRVKSDIDSYDSYLFYPDDYSESINEAFEKVHKKNSKDVFRCSIRSRTGSCKSF